jgi:hypothetical protein
LSPQAGPGGDPVPVSDAGYQQRVTDAIAGALVFWRNQAQPPAFVTAPRPNARVIYPAKLPSPIWGSNFGLIDSPESPR